MRWGIKRCIIFVAIIIIKLSAIFFLRPFKKRCSEVVVRENRSAVPNKDQGREWNFKESLEKENIIKNLREITYNLIEIRSTLDETTAEFIDEKYHFFQKILRSMDNKQIAHRRGQKAKEDNSSRLTYVCPEQYLGTKHGRPYYNEGFKRLNCTKPHVGNLVTIILDNPCYQNPNCSLEGLLTSIHKQNSRIEAHVVHNKNSLTRSGQMNKIIRNTNTLFVFVAPYLAKYDDNIDLERLIDVMTSVDNVVAVGGSVKDVSTGVWSKGCSQIELREYTLFYENGYKESMQSCVKCDILQGPFLASTDFLKQKPFRDDLREGFYEDWFLRNSPRRLDGWKRKPDRNRGLVLSCPDVMSSVLVPHIPDSGLLDFANNWDIKRIVSAKESVRWFGCRRGIKHRTAKCNILGGMIVPPCCLENLADSVKYIMLMCEKHAINCELQEGSLLGAVKFENVLPWERDADITFLTADYEKLNNLKNDFKLHGYSLTSKAEPWCCVDGMQAGGVFTIHADGWNIEMYGQHQMDSLNNSPSELPTKIEFAGQMVQVPHNPGRYARNRYGREIYKHAEHWMSTGMKSGWHDYSPGFFQDCAIPGHHGCLNQFTADGSLQFNLKKLKLKRKQQQHR